MLSTFVFTENLSHVANSGRGPDFSLRRKFARLSGTKGSVLTDCRTNTADTLNYSIRFDRVEVVRDVFSCCTSRACRLAHFNSGPSTK